LPCAEWQEIAAKRPFLAPDPSKSPENANFLWMDREKR